MIDVRDLIARYSPEEHAARADAYFEGAVSNEHLRRKPWATAGEAAWITRALSTVLDFLFLRPGIRVLDFGAGTCWSSIILAYLGCDVVATDVSKRALEVGALLKAEDPIARNLPINFAHFNSERLPLPDENVERVVCLDAFHHVADQAGTLRELYRVLKPGGRMAFAEPGPDHSRSPQSQHEMRLSGVIENDIIVEDIDRMAREIGFLPMEIAYQIPSPIWLDVATFNRRVAGNFEAGETDTILREAGKQLLTRTFFLVKPGAEELDSRGTVGLGGEIAMRVKGSKAIGHVKNTGRSAWRPSGPEAGAVNVGVSLIGADGVCCDVNFARGPVSTLGVPPGTVVELAFDIPPVPAGCSVAFDLVAENVAWFFAQPLDENSA